MRKLTSAIATASAVIVISACSQLSPIPADATIECGPVVDPGLCRRAAEVAAQAKINPPPIAAVRLRLPDAGDECTIWARPCGDDAVIVSIQSGDTIQAVPVVRSADGWTLLKEPN
jgi:hypothetical protein